MDRSPPPSVAVTLTVAAGVLHLVAARGHASTTVLAVSMAVVGLAQIATVATARRWPSGTAEAIVALDLAAVGAWAVSRTVGLPLVAGGPEAVGAGDLVVVGLQLAAVIVLALPERIGAARSDLAPYALVVGLLAVGMAAPDVGHAHRAPTSVVRIVPGDVGDAAAVTDHGGADTMRAMMTGAGAPPATAGGGTLGSGDGHAHGHGTAEGHEDGGH